MIFSKTRPRIAAAITVTAFALSVPAARAVIVYVDLPAGTHMWQFPSLDLEGDGVFDVYFWLDDSDCLRGCSLYISVDRAEDGVVVSQQEPQLQWAAALPWGTPIEPTCDYRFLGRIGLFGLDCRGPWCEPGQILYLGLRFTIAGSTHYAWMRTQSSTFILFDYAYETAPDTPITAGAGFPCAADLNGDNQIDIADLATLLAHFGAPDGATHADGDLDADGDVDLSDLTAFLALFGTTCS